MVGSRRRLEAHERRTIAALDRYVCSVRPARADASARAELADMKMVRAQVYQQAGQLDRAAIALRDLAFHHPRSPKAARAANLYIQVLDAMRTRWTPRRVSCAGDMVTDVPRLVGLYCSGPTRGRETCGDITRAARQLRRLEAERRLAQAESAPEGGRRHYLAGAAIYMDLWRSRGETRCLHKASDCPTYAEVLHRAARAYQRAHRLDEAMAARRLLIDERYGLGDHALARRAMLDLGKNHQASAVYDRAAHYYERFAMTTPTHAEASGALKDAIVLRLGLGQHERALKNARLFRDLFGRRRPAQEAQITFAIARHQAERGNHRAAHRELAHGIRRIARHGDAALAVDAHALLVRVAKRQGRHAEVSAAYTRLATLAADVHTVRRSIDAAGGPAGARERRFQRLLRSMGEALFQQAESKRAQADALTLPRYRGDRGGRDIDRFVRGRLRPWLLRKGRALGAAAAAYRRVIQLNHPAPPPRWAVAAGIAMGTMWGDFAQEILNAPYPTSWDRPGAIPNVTPKTLWHEQRARFQALLGEAAAPYRLTAKRAYVDCVGFGVRYQQFDDKLRRCASWLSNHYPRELRAYDRYRGFAMRARQRLGVPAPPQPRRTDGAAPPPSER